MPELEVERSIDPQMDAESLPGKPVVCSPEEPEARQKLAGGFKTMRPVRGAGKPPHLPMKPLSASRPR